MLDSACWIAVHSPISSCLNYCNYPLIRLPHAQINKLQHVMNCAARLILGDGKFDHITPVLKSLHWLPVELRIKFKVTCLAWKVLHGLASSYLSNTLARYQPARSLWSTGQDLLVVSKIRTERYGAMQPPKCTMIFHLKFILHPPLTHLKDGWKPTSSKLPTCES